jgi:hypothetical protein
MRCVSESLCSAAVLTCLTATAAFGWGAIAVDHAAEENPDEAGYASEAGYPTRAAASRAALTACRSTGSESCELVVVFKKCGAYASSLNYYGVGVGATLKQAEQRALSDCNDKDCVIVVSDCD